MIRCVDKYQSNFNSYFILLQYYENPRYILQENEQ